MRNRELVASAEAWFHALVKERVAGTIEADVSMRIAANSAAAYIALLKGETINGRTLEDFKDTDAAFGRFADTINAEKQGFPNV